MMAPVFLFLTFEFQRLGEFLPLAVLGHLEGGATFLLEDIGGVVLQGEGGGEVFGAVIVDEGEGGRLVVLDLCRGDDPAEGVVFLAEIAWQRAVEFLSRHFYILVVEVDLEEDLIFIIIYVRAERSTFALGERSEK